MFGLFALNKKKKKKIKSKKKKKKKKKEKSKCTKVYNKKLKMDQI